MPSTVVMIRHGQTDWNRRKRFQGRVDIPLNDAGRAQARKLHEELAGYDFDLCFSSPLRRSLETARIALGDSDTPVLPETDLVEQAYGLGEGSSYRHTPWYYLGHAPALWYNEDPERYVPVTGAESFDELYARAQGFIDGTLREACEHYGAILVSAHCGIDCAIEGLIRGVPFSRFWSVKLPNCGHSVFTYEDGAFTFDAARSSEKPPYAPPRR